MVFFLHESLIQSHLDGAELGFELLYYEVFTDGNTKLKRTLTSISS